jgi:hypothetical protein
MIVNDRNEEVENDHWSVTENYWSKPRLYIRKLKSIVSERRKRWLKRMINIRKPKSII